MENGARIHPECYNKPKKRDAPYQQSFLVLTPQGLHFELPRPPPPYRTPAPNIVKRMTRAPVFSSTDKSLASLLRLPYDIRLQILRYLLRCGGVQYELCLDTSRLILFNHYGCQPYPYERHGIFPSILETCRLMYDEGSAVLYGENRFKLSRCSLTRENRRWLIFNSWPMAERNTRLVTQVYLGSWGHPTADDRAKILANPFVVFPAVRHVSVHLNFSVLNWGVFMNEYSGIIARIGSFEIQLYLFPSEVLQASNLWKERDDNWKWTKKNLEDIFLSLYRLPVAGPCKRLSNRRVDWTLYDLSDENSTEVLIRIRMY